MINEPSMFPSHLCSESGMAGATNAVSPVLPIESLERINARTGLLAAKLQSTRPNFFICQLLAVSKHLRLLHINSHQPHYFLPSINIKLRDPPRHSSTWITLQTS